MENVKEFSRHDRVRINNCYGWDISVLLRCRPP